MYVYKGKSMHYRTQAPARGHWDDLGNLELVGDFGDQPVTRLKYRYHDSKAEK